MKRETVTVSCSACHANCCQLLVFLMDDRHVPHYYTEWNEDGALVMLRLEDGWCAALDRNTMMCTIYEQRPQLCRDYEMGASDCLEQRQVDPWQKICLE